MTRRKGLPVFLLIVLASISFELGSDLGQISKDIAGRIAALQPRPESIRLLTRETVTAGQSDLREIRRLLEQELRRRRLKLADEAAAVTLTLSIGEGVKGRILITEVGAGEQTDVIILSLPGASLARRVSLQKSLLWRQEEPLLDFALVGDWLWILSPRRVSVVEKSEQGWKKRFGWNLESIEPVPRDPRGRLLVDRTNFWAFLPGFQCQGGTEPGTSVTCTADDQGFPSSPWGPSEAHIRLMPGRNYFNQIRTPRGLVRDLPPFYAAAGMSGPSGEIWALSTLDGSTRFYNSRFVEIGRTSDWASELAPAEVPQCGSYVLAVTENDDGQESVQAFQWLGERPVAGSERLELDGLVTALWPDGLNRVRLVERNLESGGYAAWSVALVCAD